MWYLQINRSFAIPWAVPVPSLEASLLGGWTLCNSHPSISQSLPHNFFKAYCGRGTRLPTTFPLQTKQNPKSGWHCINTVSTNSYVTVIEHIVDRKFSFSFFILAFVHLIEISAVKYILVQSLALIRCLVTICWMCVLVSELINESLDGWTDEVLHW